LREFRLDLRVDISVSKEKRRQDEDELQPLDQGTLQIHIEEP
jgi:hypothetical protein